MLMKRWNIPYLSLQKNIKTLSFYHHRSPAHWNENVQIVQLIKEMLKILHSSDASEKKFWKLIFSVDCTIYNFSDFSPPCMYMRRPRKFFLLDFPQNIVSMGCYFFVFRIFAKNEEFWVIFCEKRKEKFILKKIIKVVFVYTIFFYFC